ncbi:Serine/threonine-protein kinase pim-2 [Liparis tanakae]|uniref:non-specific serine/threonine protein kinase n=1 Tax=Liparis tanakae TaxID=230148 RepID=A0A4Z2HNK4_9TELE|nr:Serine/threonine-protein kinase pim-2 [Liparis tanakae]
MDYIPCENVLLSSSEDKITFPGRTKRKRTEDGESQPSKKRKSLDPIPCDNELPSTTEDKITFPGRSKRKCTEDVESQPRKKRRSLDPIPCDNELPSTTEDTESTNTPKTAPSTRRPKRKAVADDGPVRKRKRILNPLDIFKAKYQQQQLLGQGGYGSVYAGYRRADNLPVAIKYIKKELAPFIHKDRDGNQTPMEVAILQKLADESERHAAIIAIQDWYDVDLELIIVLERPVPAEDLRNYIQTKGGYLQEKETKSIIKQLVNAALHLEKKHIFHGDIKVENLLIETCVESPRVRVIDFGVSCFYTVGEAFKEFYATHVPPELFSRGEYHAGPSTVFQIGVVLFLMRHEVKYTPDMSFEELSRTRWLSKYGKDFFQVCMCPDPDLRFNLNQLKNHPWLTEC